MKPQLFTLQNWGGGVETFVAGLCGSHCQHSLWGTPDFFPSPHTRSYTTDIRLHSATFHIENPPQPAGLKVYQERTSGTWLLPSRDLRNLSLQWLWKTPSLRRKRWSLGFLICTEKAWAPSFNTLCGHLAYFQRSGILMPWKPNKPTEIHPRALKRKEDFTLFCETVCIWSMRSPQQKLLECFTRQSLEPRKGALASLPGLWLHPFDNDCLMLKGIILSIVSGYHLFMEIWTNPSSLN